jgi:hypothetical protein
MFPEGYSSAFFTMGYGIGWASPKDTTLGFSIDFSQLVGVALPFIPTEAEQVPKNI